MKNYSLGLRALILGVGLSAFTKPSNYFSTQLFAYRADLYGNTQAAIQNPSHWVAIAAQSCAPEENSDAERVCKILVSDDRYFHFDSDEGTNVLNTSGPYTMSIATQKTFNNPEVAIVIKSGTTGVAQEGDITNKPIDIIP
jgi:hypothetical protein